MLHYSANTGFVRSEPRRHTSDQVLRLISGMYEPGAHLLPVTGYRSEVIGIRCGCFGLVIKESTSFPLVSIAVAENRRAADGIWPYLLRYYEALKSCPGLDALPATVPERPAAEPWYATLMMLASPDEVPFLGDFCRHFAWGWIDRQQCRIGPRKK